MTEVTKHAHKLELHLERKQVDRIYINLDHLGKLQQRINSQIFWVETNRVIQIADAILESNREI